jgi:hypothetical protein
VFGHRRSCSAGRATPVSATQAPGRHTPPVLAFVVNRDGHAFIHRTAARKNPAPNVSAVSGLMPRPAFRKSRLERRGAQRADVSPIGRASRGSPK